MGSKPVGISASRGAAVIGLNKYKTTVEAWLEIMEEMQPGFCAAHGYQLIPREDLPQFRWGHYFEEAVICAAGEIANEVMIDRERLYTLSEQPGNDSTSDHIKRVVTCHIDATYQTTKRLHEGKTSNDRAFNATYGKPGTDRVPTYIQAQCQQQMACSGLDENIVSVLVFPRVQKEMDEHINLDSVDAMEWAKVLSEIGNFHQFPIQRNETDISGLLDAYSQFWNKNVLEEIEPDPEDYADIRRLFVNPVGTVVANERIENLMSEYKGIGPEVKNMGIRKDYIKKEVVVFMRDDGLKNGINIDKDSVEKIKLVNGKGQSLASYNGNRFTPSKRK